MMQTYKIKIEILSPIGTPIKGDTLFGCVCWGILYNDGEGPLKSLLDSFNAEPLVISDGFPENTLPRPLLPPERHATRLELEQLRVRKRVKKMIYVPASFLFESDEQNPLSEQMVIDKLIQNENYLKGLEDRRISRMHNTINRLTNTVEEGALYSRHEMWFGKGTIFDAYIVSTFDMAKLQALLEWAFLEGYGADRSTGKGTLSLKGIEKIGLPQKGNRYMALGSFVPDDKEDHLAELRAFTSAKLGKLGGHFANAMNPFKMAFLMYTAGATFDAHNVARPYVGQLLRNVHNDGRIRHHACAPVLQFFGEREQNNAIQY
jgi:CRISPR-associated protein Csm4